MDKIRGIVAVALLRILSWFPFPVLQFLGNLQGYLSGILKSRHYHTIEANLLYCFPDWTSRQRAEFTRRNLQETAKTVMEMGAIWCWPCQKTENLIRDVQGRPLLDAALAKKRGVILLTPHLGNWEMVGFFAAQVANVTSLYAPAKIPALDRLIYTGRTRNGSTLVPTNAVGVKALFKALKAGEIVIMLPDQVPGEGSGVFAPFFGKPALTMTLLASLARRTGAEVLCCYGKRRSDRRGFDICLRPAPDSITAADEVLAATAVNTAVEQCVNDCSEQYQWGYKRFREREGVEPRLYVGERRMQYRRRLREVLWVRNGEDAEGFGTVLNLSPDGLMFTSRSVLTVGEIRRIGLIRTGQAASEITAEIKCLWSRSTERPDEYQSGALITYMSTQHALRLLVWLQGMERKLWQTRLALLLLKATALLPFSVTRMAGRCRAWAESLWQTQHYRYTCNNIRKAFPDLDESQRRQWIRSSMQHYGEQFGGRAFVRLASARRIERQMPLRWRPLPALEAFHAGRQQRGTILLMPSMVGWERLLREVARQAPLTLLYQPVRSEMRNRMLYHAAVRDHYAVLTLQEGFVDTALRIAQQGCVVALLPDQALPATKPLWAPFFGGDIRTMDLWRLAQAPLEIFCAHISPAMRGATDEIVLAHVSGMTMAVDSGQCAAVLNQCLEQSILDCPPRYNWQARRFPK